MQHSNIPMKENPYVHENWTGTKNKLIRYYFYCNRGLDVFNNFRYVIMAVFGIYYTLHLHQPLWLIGMIIISVPILTIIGYYSVHHIGKVIDWLNIKFSSHYGKYTYELMENQLSELKEITRELKRDT